MQKYHLEIAGTHFLISSPIPISQKTTKAVYSQFFTADLRNQFDPDIVIHLVIEKFPLGQSEHQVFDSDQSWSVDKNESEYHLHFKSNREDGEPYWHARFNIDCNEVNVHCSEELIVHMDGERLITNPVQYPLDQLLTVYHIAQREGALIHAAGAVIQGKGLIFPGSSGAGKSTITRQFSEREQDFELLSDDRIIVRKFENDYSIFGTPWPGEAGIAKNTSHPLHGIAFIHHGTKNEIMEIDPKIALQQLLPVVSIPWYDKAIMPMIVDFCEGLVTTIPTYELHFKPDIEIASFLEDFLNEPARS
ncbi:MAG: hypothetical protein ACXADB_07115 [Candidatus Hermodarchaeia archaeon]|jgi:hypothetical protein